MSVWTTSAFGATPREPAGKQTPVWSRRLTLRLRICCRQSPRKASSALTLGPAKATHAPPSDAVSLPNHAITSQPGSSSPMNSSLRSIPRSPARAISLKRGSKSRSQPNGPVFLNLKLQTLTSPPASSLQVVLSSI